MPTAVAHCLVVPADVAHCLVPTAVVPTVVAHCLVAPAAVAFVVPTVVGLASHCPVAQAVVGHCLVAWVVACVPAGHGPPAAVASVAGPAAASSVGQLLQAPLLLADQLLALAASAVVVVQYFVLAGFLSSLLQLNMLSPQGRMACSRMMPIDGKLWAVHSVAVVVAAAVHQAAVAVHSAVFQVVSVHPAAVAAAVHHAAVAVQVVGFQVVAV